MSLVKKIIGQSAIYFIGTIFSVLVGFFFKIYLSNKIGSEGLGLFTLGMSSVAIASIFLTFGYGNGLIRFVSKYLANKQYNRLSYYLKKTVFINILTLIPLSLIYFLFPDFVGGKLLNSKKLIEYIPLFGIVLIINSFLSIGDQTIRGFQEVKKSTIVHHFIRLPFKIILTVILFGLGMSLGGYLWAEIFAALLSVILFVFILKKLVPTSFSFINNKITKSNLEEKKYALNMFLIELLGVLQNHGEKIILVYFMSESELGVYSIILSIVAFIPTILVSVTSIFSPIVSAFHSTNQLEKLSQYYRYSVKYIFVLSFPLIAFIVLYNEIILQFFGEDFSVGYHLLWLVAIGELINTSFGSVGTMLKMMGYDKMLRNISAITSILTFFASFILIHYFGLVGVGVAYILKNISYNLGASIVLYKKSSINIFDFSYTKTIVLYFALFGVLFSIYQPINVSILYLFLGLIIIYIIFICFWTLLLGKKDYPIIIKLIKNDL